MDRLYRGRRFGLALLYTLSGIVALFTGVMEAGSFITLAGIVLGLYGGIELIAPQKDD